MWKFELVLSGHARGKTEKYGTLLADVYCENFCINQWLVDERFAVKYDGGTKEKPASWFENVIY